MRSIPLRSVSFILNGSPPSTCASYIITCSAYTAHPSTYGVLEYTERRSLRHFGVSRLAYAPCTTWPGIPSCIVRSSILYVLYSRSLESARTEDHSAGIGVTQ